MCHKMSIVFLGLNYTICTLSISSCLDLFWGFAPPYTIIYSGIEGIIQLYTAKRFVLQQLHP